MRVCCVGGPAAAPQLLAALGIGLAVAHAVGWTSGRWSGNFEESGPFLRDCGFRRDFSQVHSYRQSACE